MRNTLYVVLTLCLAMTIGCAKKVQAPIPGQINQFDAYAFRVLSVEQASLLGAKAWETCSDQGYPKSVTVDGHGYDCSVFGGHFPDAARQPLFHAEQSYNTAQAAWKTYRSSATNDPVALQNAINQLVADVTGFFTVAAEGGAK